MNYEDYIKYFVWLISATFFIVAIAKMIDLTDVIRDFVKFYTGSQMSELKKFRTVGSVEEVIYTINSQREEIEALTEALEMDKGDMN